MGNKGTSKEPALPTPKPLTDQTNQHNNRPHKIVLLGDIGVGKKSLLLRATQDHFLDCPAFDYDQVTPLTLGNTKLNLLVYPVPVARFTQRKPPFRGTVGVFLCFDCESGLSFWNLLRWREEVERYCNEECRIVVVETKNDSNRRVVPEGAGSVMAELMGVTFYSTSSKIGVGVQECFEEMSKIVSNMDWLPNCLSVTQVITPPIPPTPKRTISSIILPIFKSTTTSKEDIGSFEVLPEELLSLILVHLNSSALFRLTSTAKSMSYIWKHIKHLDLTVGNWSLSYIIKIIPLLSKNSYISFTLSYSSQHKEKNKLDDLISKSEEHGVFLIVKSNGYNAWNLPEFTPLTGSTIVEMEDLLKIEDLCANFTKLPSLKKFKPLYSSKGFQEKAIPCQIEELIITDSYLPFICSLTNLKKLIVSVSGVNVDWLTSLTQLTDLEINDLPHPSLLPPYLKTLRYKNSHVDLQHLINYTCLKSLDTTTLLSSYLLSSFTQLTSLNISNVLLDDLVGLSNLESLTVSNFSGSFGTLKAFYSLHTLCLYSPNIEFDPSILHNKPLLTFLSLQSCNLKPSDITNLPHLPQLKKLNLGMNVQLDNTIFDHLSKFCSLEALHLDNLLHINTIGVQSLSSLNLLYLNISGCLGVEFIDKWRFPEATILNSPLDITPNNLTTLLLFKGIQPPAET